MSIIGESCLLSCPISSILATTPWSLDTSHQQIFRAVVLLKQRCYDSLLAGDEKSVTTDAVWSTPVTVFPIISEKVFSNHFSRRLLWPGLGFKSLRQPFHLETRCQTLPSFKGNWFNIVQPSSFPLWLLTWVMNHWLLEVSRKIVLFNQNVDQGVITGNCYIKQCLYICFF